MWFSNPIILRRVAAGSIAAVSAFIIVFFNARKDASISDEDIPKSVPASSTDEQPADFTGRSVDERDAAEDNPEPALPVTDERLSEKPKAAPVPAARRILPETIKMYGLTFHRPTEHRMDTYGRMVCAHDDDAPKKSTRDKPVHKDMQCCLDPDEIPNPFCYYPRREYGKLLDDFERKKEKMLRRYRNGDEL